MPAPSDFISKELIELSSRLAMKEGFQRTAIKSLSICRYGHKTQAMPIILNPSILFVVQGDLSVRVGQTALRSKSWHFMANSVAVPIALQITGANSRCPYLGLILELDPTLIYELVRDLETTEPYSGHIRKGLIVEKSKLDLADAFLRLLHAAGRVDDQIVLAPMIIREIFYRLLRSKHGGSIQQMGIAGSQTQRVSRVIDVMRRDFATPLKIESLARTAKMSPSSFHTHFKQVTTLSPLQYQKHLRLQEARKLLAHAAIDAEDAGFQVGYESPSQFSREYARMFGLPPLSDKKRMKK